MNILIVGIGNMGFAIAKALQKSAWSHTLYAYDPWSKFLDDARTLGIKVHNSLDSASHKNCAYDGIVVCVKPSTISSTLQSLLPIVRFTSPTVLSIAAGVAIDTLSESLRQEGRAYAHVVRLMPTIAAQVGKSITAVSLGPHANESDRKRAFEVAKSFGDVMEIPETQMDAFTGIAGSGIAFVSAFVDALTLSGVKEGLPYENAYKAAQHATEGALALLQSTFRCPSELMTAVSSPQGTTIAGLVALHQHGMYASVMNAVHAAAERSRAIAPILPNLAGTVVHASAKRSRTISSLGSMKEDFEQYLIGKGYKQNTVNYYSNGIDKISKHYKKDIYSITDSEELEQIRDELNTGAKNEALGNAGHRTVYNAMAWYCEFFGEYRKHKA